MGLFDGIADTLKNEKEFRSEISKGNNYFKNQDYNSAKKHFNKALKIKLNDNILRKKLICEYYLQNYDVVVKSNFNNDNNDFKLIKAKSYFYLKNYDEALKNVNVVLQNDENDNDALLLKGSILYNQNVPYAINFFKRCREEFGNDFNFNLKCFIYYMYCLISFDNYNDAIRISNLILSKSKDNIDALIVKGLTYYNQKSYLKALEIFDKIYSLYGKEKQDKYLNKYIDCIIKDKSLSPDEIYVKISQLDNHNLHVFKYKALTSSFFKTNQEQLDYINSILDEFKDDEEILLKKANLCYELGLIDDSLNCLKNLGSKNAVLFKIKVLYNLNKYDDVLNIFESSKNIITDSDSLLLIAESLFKLKKYDKAKIIYDELIEKNFSFDLKNYIDCVLIIASECEDSKDSIDYFNEILKVDDKNIFVLTLLYKTYLEEKNYEKSLGVINKVLNIEESEEVLADKILVLNNLEKYDEASDLLNKVSGVDVNLRFILLTKIKEYDEAFKYIDKVDEYNDNILISKVEVNFHLGNYDEVLNIVDNALKNNPDNISLLLFKSNSLCKLGKYNESILGYNSILRIDDGSIEALKGKSYCLFKLNKYYDALDIYDELIELDNDITILEKRAISLYNIDEKLEALDDFEKVVKSDKSRINHFKTEYIESLIVGGNAENKNNSFNDAIMYFDKVLDLDLNNIDALYGKLYSYSKLNDDNQIINTCNEILKLNMDEDVLSKKAISLLNINDYINSINCFEELDNNKLNDYLDEYTSALRNYAIIEYKNNNYEIALKYFDKFLTHIPDEEIEYYKADCYYNLGDLDKSIKCFESLDINKYKSQYIEVLYHKALEVDNSEKVDLLDLILKLDHDNFNALVLKSKALFDLKNYDETIGCCKIILKLDSANIDILKIYAKSLFYLDEYEKAYGYFSKFDDDESRQYLEKSRQNIIKNLLDKSKNYYNLKKWEELIQVSDEILTYDSINYSALLNKSKALFNLNQFNEAYSIFKSFNLDDISDYKDEYLETLKELGFKNNDLGYLNEYLDIEFSWDILFKKSEILYQSGYPNEAIECYETLLLNDDSKLNLFKDKYIELLLNKAKNYCNLSKYKKSLPNLEKILKLDNQHEKALIYKAHCLYKLKNYDDALEIANSILERNDNKNILILKAETLYLLKDYLESIKCYNQLNDSKFDNKKEIVIKAFVKEYKNKIKNCDENKILDSLDYILPHIPNNYELLKIKSNALYKLKMYEECINVSNQCLDILIRSDVLEIKLNSLFYLEKYDDYIEEYENLSYETLISKLKKDYLKALNVIGIILFNDKNYKEAIEYFKKILKIEYDEKILNCLALSYYNLGKYSDAIKNWDIILDNNSSIDSYKMEYIDSIWNIISKNSYDNYLTNLNKILYLDENNIEALTKKADYFISKSQFKEALELYEKLDTIDESIFNQYKDNYCIALKELGLQNYNNKLYQESLIYFNHFLEINENPDIRYLKADCHYKLNQLDESIENYQLISDINQYKRDFIDVLYAKAMECDAQDSIKYCDLILDLENNNLNALILKSKSLFNLKQYSDVVNICCDILNMDEENFEVIVIYAKSLFKIKDYENAFKQFENALSIEPKYELLNCLEETRQLIINSLLNQSKEHIDKDWEELLKFSDKILKYDGNNYKALLNKSKALFNLKDYDGAILIFREFNPENISDFKKEYLDSLREIISFECESNNYTVVLDYCDEFLNIEYDFNILYKKAESLYKLHQYSEAISIYQKILNDDDSKINDFKDYYINSLIQLGKYYSSEIFNFKKAIEYWDEILKYDKDNVDVLFNKIMSLFKLNEYNEVIRYCDEILNIDENNLKSLHIKSKVLFELGNYTEVINTCNSILDKDQNCFKALKLKSKALYEINNYLDAIETINQALKINFDIELNNLKENAIDKYIEDYLDEVMDITDPNFVLKSINSKLDFVPYCMDLLEIKADALFNLKKYSPALECYDVFLLFDFSVGAMLNKLYCLYYLDDKEAFIKLFLDLKDYYENIDKKLIDYYYDSMKNIIFSLFEDGKYDDVVIYVDELLKQIDDINLKILKANALFMQNEYSRALEEYEFIISEDNSKLNEFKECYIECLFVKIESLINQNNLLQSLTLINTILDIDSDNEKALKLKYDLLFELIHETYHNKDYKTALNLINDYLKVKSDDKILIIKGKILIQLEEFKEAIDTFESINSNFDEFKCDYYSALQFYVSSSDLDDDELLIYYDKILNISIDDKIILKKAIILLNKCLLIESKNCLDDLKNIDDYVDDYLDLILSLAIKFKENKDFDNSLELFNKILSYKQDNTDVLSNLIELNFDKENYDEVIKLGNRLLELDKANIKDLYYLATSYYKQEDYNNAYTICDLILEEKSCEDIINIHEKSKQEIIINLNNHAMEFIKNESYASALNYYDEILSYDNLNQNVLLNKATLLVRVKRYDEAIDCYDVILNINPNKYLILSKLCLLNLENKSLMVFDEYLNWYSKGVITKNDCQFELNKVLSKSGDIVRKSCEKIFYYIEKLNISSFSITFEDLLINYAKLNYDESQLENLILEYGIKGD